MMQNRKFFMGLVLGAVLLKLALFALTIQRAPESKFAPDTAAYAELAETLSSKGVFAIHNPDGSLEAHFYRTPGYPVFLALTHHFLKIPFTGVAAIQILMTVLAAFVTFKTASKIDPKIAALAAVMLLYDFPTAIVSMKILTEPLYLLLISFFFLCFAEYLCRGKWKPLLLAALFLTGATYVRPVSYYLGAVAAVFILYANPQKNLKSSFFHGLVFSGIVYALLGVWQLRNAAIFGQSDFAAASSDNFKWQGLLSVCVKEGHSFFASAVDCTVKAGDGLVRFMTKPGLLKVYDSSGIRIAGQIAAVAILIFQLLGFFAGCFKIGRNKQYQWLLLVFFYFAAATILNVSGSVGERYRVPVMPCLAILSAYGWTRSRRGVTHSDRLSSRSKCNI